jgi:hypothetical protein
VAGKGCGKLPDQDRESVLVSKRGKFPELEIERREPG